MLHTFIRLFIVTAVLSVAASTVVAQQNAAPAAAAAPAPPYGLSIDIANAKKAAAAAVAEARKNNWTMAVAIVDTGGFGVYFERMDGTQTGSADIAFDKARSAVMFRRPTKVFEDGLAAGGAGFALLVSSWGHSGCGRHTDYCRWQDIGAIGASGGTNVSGRGDCSGRSQHHKVKWMNGRSISARRFAPRFY
jgi:uncharacterized protein GlcG (DUF336 family)